MTVSASHRSFARSVLLILGSGVIGMPAGFLLAMSGALLLSESVMAVAVWPGRAVALFADTTPSGFQILAGWALLGLFFGALADLIVRMRLAHRRRELRHW